eukprot:scaffold3135_cov352-Prasinococcus_capsulatus_cf.AAC.10
MRSVPSETLTYRTALSDDRYRSTQNSIGNSGKACPAPSEPSGHAPEGPGGVGGVGSIGVGGGLGDGVSGGGGKLIGGGGKLGGVESGGHSPGTGAQGEKAKISEAPASDKMMSTRHVSPAAKSSISPPPPRPTPTHHQSNDIPSGKGEPSLLVIAVSGPFDPTGMSALPDRSTPTTLPFAPLTSKPLPRKPLPLTAGVQGAPSMLIPNYSHETLSSGSHEPGEEHNISTHRTYLETRYTHARRQVDVECITSIDDVEKRATAAEREHRRLLWGTSAASFLYIPGQLARSVGRRRHPPFMTRQSPRRTQTRAIGAG